LGIGIFDYAAVFAEEHGDAACVPTHALAEDMDQGPPNLGVIATAQRKKACELYAVELTGL
jgi:hypothetical protein